MGSRFEFRDVHVDGDDGPIVAGFSAHIPADGLTVVTGRSGAGKTTLLRLLNRLDDPDGGAVFYDGRDVREYDVLALRRRVQLVSQVPVTFPGTVAENLVVGPGRGPNPGVLRKAGTPAPPRPSAEEVGHLLARVGLSPALAARQADRLSVGEAQRMALGRALACNPDALLLDEPTSALDGDSKAVIERLVRTLADNGLTVVMISHDQHASDLGDHVVRVGGTAS